MSCLNALKALKTQMIYATLVLCQGRVQDTPYVLNEIKPTFQLLAYLVPGAWQPAAWPHAVDAVLAAQGSAHQAQVTPT